MPRNSKIIAARALRSRRYPQYPQYPGRGSRGSKRSCGSRKSQKQEGLILLSVLLVILMGTAIAMLTARDTRYALRSAGHDRNAIQGAYAAEAILMGTIGLFDKLGDHNFQAWIIDPWCNDDGVTAPFMMPYWPEPNIPLWFGYDPNPVPRACAARTVSNTLRTIQLDTWEIMPLTNKGEPTRVGVDFNGVFGDVAYSPSYDVGLESNYIVDLYDCTQMAKENDRNEHGRLRCLVTARHKSEVIALPNIDELWNLDTKHPNMVQGFYRQVQFRHLHEATAVIETPKVVL